MAPFTFVGHVKVLLPVESWQIVTVKRASRGVYKCAARDTRSHVISIVSPVDTSIVTGEADWLPMLFRLATLETLLRDVTRLRFALPPEPETETEYNGMSWEFWGA